MDLIYVKCPFCGEVFKTELKSENTLCNKCSKEFPTQKGSKYYKSIQKIQNDKNKVALGEQYAKVDNLLLKGEFYLDNEDFENALKVYSEALEITTSDYRVYLGFVYTKTRNFTDLDDQSHVEYLKKAIELASTEQKTKIKKIYSTYYKKRKVPKEERDEYMRQENQSRLGRIEELLKDGIPRHFKREKSVKLFLVLLIVSAVIAIPFTVLNLFVSHPAILITAVVFYVLLFASLCYYSSTRAKVKIYNFALDLYDEFNSFEFALDNLNKILKHYEIFCVSYINNETETTLKTHIMILCNLIIEFGGSKVEDFVFSYNYIKKLI